VRSLSDRSITSGKIVACDGLIPSIEPFSETVEPGSYPVVLSIAQVGNEWPVIACAMLRIQEKMSATWKRASVAGRDRSAGYGVDTANGCFADLDVMQVLITSAETYERLKKTVNRPGVEWVDFRLDATGLSNIIVFSSGYGDGAYPCYFGYDADGEVVCLATDFGVLAPLPGKEAETPSKHQLRLDF